MKTLKCLVAAGSLLAALQSFAAVQPPAPAPMVVVAHTPGEDWLTHYYENPRPDALPLAAHQLSREGYFENAGQTATAIGFFASVFAANPDSVNFWLRATSDLPEKHRRILVAAAWQAGSPRGATLLREMAETSSPDTRREIAEMMQRGPSALSETPVRSESSMNLQWGAFLASGQEQPIVSVLSALGSGENSLSTAARYSLAQNAAEHRRVLDICRAQLSKQPDSVRSELRAALNDAGLLARPGA